MMSVNKSRRMYIYMSVMYVLFASVFMYKEYVNRCDGAEWCKYMFAYYIENADVHASLIIKGLPVTTVVRQVTSEGGTVSHDESAYKNVYKDVLLNEWTLNRLEKMLEDE